MIDDRLRDALAAHDPSVSPPPWEEIERRALAMRAAGRRRRAAVVMATAAAIAVIALAVGVLVRDEGDGVSVVADEPRPTTTIETTTTTPNTTSPPAPVFDPAAVDGIYPDRTAYERDGADRYRDARVTATAFATEYLAMTTPVVEPVPDSDTAWTLRPNRRASLTTTLELRRVGEDGPWTVTKAATPGIVVRSPAASATVTSPLRLEGSARAYEGNVLVEVREDGMRAGASLGETFVTGGGDQLVPFSGSVTFRAPSEAAGAVLFVEPSGEDGGTMAATVVRVRFGGATGGEPSPRPPAALGHDSRLRFDGVGPINFGMSVAEAKFAARIPMREQDLPGCIGLHPTESPAGLDLLAPRGDGVRYAVVKSAPIVTDEGIGVGTTEAAVMRAYPAAEVRNASEPVHRIVRFGSGQFQPYVMVFEIQDGVVASMFSGPRDAANSDELCS